MILQTERLMLRELTVDDAAHFYNLNTDPLVIKYTGDPPFDNIGHAYSFLKQYEQYKKYGYGRWAVIRKEDKEWLGWCGLKYEKEYKETDIGYRFYRKYWNKGYATEAAKASLEYGLNKLNLKTIVGRAMKENPASIRVFEKIGMSYVEDFIYEGAPAVLYNIKGSSKE
ncbi:MAG TPA: N-acetyltransferase [Bacteroidetes bacterium]|nr:N-acetyltransferase [Bacteroidota bacterium]